MIDICWNVGLNILKFAQAEAANSNLLLAKFFSHITKLSRLAEELRNYNSPVTDQQLIMRTLHSLPPSYRTFQPSWLSVPVAYQTILNLVADTLKREK